MDGEPQAVNDELSETQVADYLRRNPTFFQNRPELLSVIEAPVRDLGEGVHDFQHALIQRLKVRVEETTEVAQELIDTSRDNLNSTTRVHECVLRMLAATSFEELIAIVHTDLAVVLDMDATSFIIESETAISDFPVKSVTLAAPGTINRLIGPGKDIALRTETPSDSPIFGEMSSLIRSDALVRVKVSDDAPAAMLAFGHRDPFKFHEGQATELIGFLAAVLAQLIRIWLDIEN